MHMYNTEKNVLFAPSLWVVVVIYLYIIIILVYYCISSFEAPRNDMGQWVSWTHLTRGTFTNMDWL